MTSTIKTALYNQQVAQLWQTDHTKLALFSINVQLYSQNQKLHFRATLGHQGQYNYISALSKSFNAKKHCSRFYRENVGFIRKIAK